MELEVAIADYTTLNNDDDKMEMDGAYPSWPKNIKIIWNAFRVVPMF